MFHTIVSIKNDGHYFCRAGGNRPDGLNEPVTVVLTLQQSSGLNDKTSPGNFYCMPSTKHFWHTT
ncbi:hypothetical protein EEQ66_22785 [Escherichia coli]|nr:hypothetical protein [Escherichia coli]